MPDSGPLILVVEDEAPLRRFLRAALSTAGYRVQEAATVAEARLAIPSWNPEVILLDMGLPDGDGLQLTRQLREWCTAPIVVISARGLETDKVAALDAGADDYLTKPFGTGELLARIRVALRHALARGARPEVVITVGDVTIDHGARIVRRGETEIHLTPLEFRLVSLLARNAGKVITQGTLLREVWGPGSQEQAHNLRVFVAGLRRKLELDPARPRLILTETGVGYRMVEGTENNSR